MAESRASLELSADIKEFADRQYANAYWLLEAARYPSGLYADAYYTFREGPGPMGSIAATGVGIVGLTLAHLEQWDPQALPKLRQTLELVTCEGASARGPVARDPASGFFYHFYHGDTGAAWEGSEISTIDTAILVAGALFAARQLGAAYPWVNELVQKLLRSVDWRLAIAPGGRAINMVIDRGAGAHPNNPFSEYAIVAYLAYLADPHYPDAAVAWEEVYRPERVDQYRRLTYQGLRLFGHHGEDGRTYYLSSFVCQFPLYLIPDYADSPVYHEIVRDHCLADRISWQAAGKTPSYIWGHGAGSNAGLPPGRDGYRVDYITHSSGVASPYIVAGYLPVFPEGIYDLYALYSLHLPYDRYTNPQDPEDERKIRTAYRYGLGRFSWSDHMTHRRWYPEKVTLIDWSTMLYGLAAFRHGIQLFGSHPDPVVPKAAPPEGR